MRQRQRLCWGCGETTPDGWINSDSHEGPGIDVSCDIVLDGLPLEGNSIDYVFVPHALHQLEVYDVLTALRELWRVLKPGGVIRLCLADLDKAIDSLKSGHHDYFWCQDWSTISGNFISQMVEHNYTRTPLNYEFTEELLQKAGFTEVRRSGYRQTTSPFAEIVELDRRPEDSFYVEALKPESAMTAQVLLGTPSQVHLSWVRDPSTSLTVVWHTPAAKDRCTLEYRELGSQTWNSKTGMMKGCPGSGVLHQVTIDGLCPSTDYEYRVSGNDKARPATIEVFQARTAPASGAADFRFAFICDTGLIGRRDGNSTGVEKIVDELIADKPLFILGGGDYAYADKDDRFGEISEAIDSWFVQMEPVIARFPFMAQYGNHEILLQERFRDWAPRFAHPEGFDRGKNYSFDVGDVHFTALFVPGLPLDPGLLFWLDTDLTDARRRGTRWLIVYQHEPIYAHGYSHPAKPHIRKFLAPILEKHRVDLHLSGHDQNYERTYPLTGVPDNPTPTSNSLYRYEAGKGVIYAKVSPSGKKSDIRNDFSRFTTAQPFMAARDDTAHHYALITVRSTGELQVNVYGIYGDERSKRLVDSFCIVWNQTKPP